MALTEQIAIYVFIGLLCASGYSLALMALSPPGARPSDELRSVRQIFLRTVLIVGLWPIMTPMLLRWIVRPRS